MECMLLGRDHHCCHGNRGTSDVMHHVIASDAAVSGAAANTSRFPAAATRPLVIRNYKSTEMLPSETARSRVRTHRQTDGQHENIMPPALSRLLNGRRHKNRLRYDDQSPELKKNDFTRHFKLSKTPKCVPIETTTDGGNM